VTIGYRLGPDDYLVIVNARRRLAQWLRGPPAAQQASSSPHQPLGIKHFLFIAFLLLFEAIAGPARLVRHLRGLASLHLEGKNTSCCLSGVRAGRGLWLFCVMALLLTGGWLEIEMGTALPRPERFRKPFRSALKRLSNVVLNQVRIEPGQWMV
jgi:hypothetical protein